MHEQSKQSEWQEVLRNTGGVPESADASTKDGPTELMNVSTKPKWKPNPKAPRQVELLLAPEARLEECGEVALGFTPEQVKIEVLRCLQCKDPTCIEACPLHIDIKAFIGALGEGECFLLNGLSYLAVIAAPWSGTFTSTIFLSSS